MKELQEFVFLLGKGTTITARGDLIGRKNSLVRDLTLERIVRIAVVLLETIKKVCDVRKPEDELLAITLCTRCTRLDRMTDGGELERVDE